MADGTEKDNGDYLGYGVYADTLWTRVEAALNKDQGDPDKLGDDPLVVGIFGEWGAGKSKLLSLILERAQRQRNERIAAHKGDDGFSLTVPVFFQPWKYEHEKHLLVPLLLHIEAELTRCLTLAETTSNKAKGKAVSVAQAVKAHVPAVVEGFKTLWGAARTAYQLAEPTSAGVLLPLAEWLAGQLAKDGLEKKDGLPPLPKFRWDAEGGRSYYELHEVLKAVTRPTPEGIKKHLPNANVDSSFRINFVIFIDDLDRCLPEKAVETLELIKTVFNLESFAFVLALDEEVVERGIGHRYKDYALHNKKPEMPITGFEYLEKIVHLPFRLPGLTPQKALQFLQKYEEENVLCTQLRGKYSPQAWMCGREFVFKSFEPLTGGNAAERGEGWKRGDELQKTESVTLNLAALVVNSFDAHVPRKLVRVVELFHQTLAVLTHRGRSDQVVPGGLIDPRLLMAFVLLQLFQPDLYRTCRRSLTGFNVLLDAMKEPEKAMLESRPAAQALSKQTSDADLWYWAVGWVGDKPPVSQRAALSRVPDLQPVERHESQRILLPLASRLVEHRATQRHVFDPMRLFEQLRPLLEESVPQPINSAVYFGVLAWDGVDGGLPEDGWIVQRKKDETTDALGAHGLHELVANAETGVRYKSLAGLSGRMGVFDLDELHSLLSSGQDSERERLYKQVALKNGETLSIDLEEALLSRLEAEAKQLSGVRSQELPLWRSRVLHGLTYLATHFDRTVTGKRWWRLVEEAAQDPTSISEFRTRDEMDLLARWMDVRGALGQDGRFDAGRLHLPAERRSQDAIGVEQEPIVGFVRVFLDDAQSFRTSDGVAVTLQAFYIARYLTTVDQYSHFVANQGYGDPEGKKPDWWDSLGWEWRIGQWGSKVKATEFRRVLDLRTPKLRGAPMYWNEQRAYGSRPVMGLNWFEARAYANWLTIQLKAELTRFSQGYVFRLPTEAQWERSIRAKDHAIADLSEYSLAASRQQMEELVSYRRFNGISNPRPVGLSIPNPLGIFDFMGDTVEWMSSLYRRDGGGQNEGFASDIGHMRTQEAIAECDLPAVRSGAWINPIERAQTRFGVPPDYSDHSLGFRLALLLPE